MTTARYSCSQSALYKASKKVLQHMDSHLEKFTLLKGKYTRAYLLTLMEQLGKTEELIAYQALLKKSETLHEELCRLSSDCTFLWGYLKRYILAAFPKDEAREKLEQAGHAHYKKAIGKNWNATNALLMAAKHFIQMYSPILMLSQNMPQDFPEKFSNAYMAFSKGLFNFRQSEREIRTGTLIKITANNDLFEKISEICQDGQIIFRRQSDLREQFVFNTLIRNTSIIQKNELRRSDTQIPPEYARMQDIEETVNNYQDT